MAPLIVLILATLGRVAGLAFCPADKLDVMWDTWLYRRPDRSFLLNYLVDHHSPSWNAVSSAISSDGAHFADIGVSIRKDCANSSSDCAVWLGSGSVWRRLGNTTRDEWIMNFSQEYDCGGGNCQSIFFATSSDLVSWQPVAPDAQRQGGLVFKYNTSEYVQPGRWDCIAVLPRPAGGYYGYWTATPKPQPGAPGYCGKGKSCGAGFGQSDDGLNWSTLATPGPAVAGEVGGVAQLGSRTFMTFDAGHLFEAPSPEGPFTASAKNYNFLTQEGHSAFPRLWGEPYTQDPQLVLVTHQQVNKGSIYAGLIKRAALGADGVLRAVWWEANDVLRGDPLEPVSMPNGRISTSCVADCMYSGLWIDGTLNKLAADASGLWLQTNSSQGSTGGLGLVFSPVDGVFELGGMRVPGQWDAHQPLRIDRSMAGYKSLQFRALVRNSWSGDGMTEFYVNDVLSLPMSQIGELTGVFQPLGGAKVVGLNRLTLPQQK